MNEKFQRQLITCLLFIIALQFIEMYVVNDNVNAIRGTVKAEVMTLRTTIQANSCFHLELPSSKDKTK